MMATTALMKKGINIYQVRYLLKYSYDDIGPVMYQYLLGKVSTVVVKDGDAKKAYQYLLGKVSTMTLVCANWHTEEEYQYLLGKVSTRQPLCGCRKDLVSISIR